MSPSVKQRAWDFVRPVVRIGTRSLDGLVRWLGYEIRYVGREDPVRIAMDLYLGSYRENPEVGPVNLAEKQRRVLMGGPFEWPDIVALNKAVVSLVGDARNILELGGGTGCFAFQAGEDPARRIVCSELDGEALKWAQTNRPRENVCYINRLATASDGPFDLVVAVEVVEHIAEYHSFLESCTTLAPRAIITTPNKNRSRQSAVASPPALYKHVREWTAGELYWVLKTYYRSVKLYSMPDPLVPQVVPIRITDSLTPVIALCEQPHGIWLPPDTHDRAATRD